MDPYSDVLAHKYLSLRRYNSKGLRSRKYSYVKYWEEKVDKLLNHFSSEVTLRKGISFVRQSQRHVSNKEAFCSLAATDGSVAEASGKLLDMEFYKEIQLVCKIINLYRYRRLLEEEVPATGTLRPRHSVGNGASDTSRQHHTHGSLSSVLVSLSGASASLHSTGSRSNNNSNNRKAHKSSRSVSGMMDITRADFESLFAPTATTTAAIPEELDDSGDLGLEAPIGLGLSPTGPPQLTRQISALSMETMKHNPSLWSAVGAPSRKGLRQILDMRLHSQARKDVMELRILSASVAERHRTYPSKPDERIVWTTMSLESGEGWIRRHPPSIA